MSSPDGAARVSIHPGVAPHARRLVFSIRGGADLQPITFVAWALIDVCGGVVRGDGGIFDYEGRVADTATAEACVAAHGPSSS